METKLKTTMKCAGCVAKATPFLNEALGEGQWFVDLTSPERPLHLKDSGAETKAVDALQKAGFKGTKS